MFELATSEEVDKLGMSKVSSEEGRFTDEIDLGEVSALSVNFAPDAYYLERHLSMLPAFDAYKENLIFFLGCVQPRASLEYIPLGIQCGRFRAPQEYIFANRSF